MGKEEDAGGVCGEKGSRAFRRHTQPSAKDDFDPTPRRVWRPVKGKNGGTDLRSFCCRVAALSPCRIDCLPAHSSRWRRPPSYPTEMDGSARRRRGWRASQASLPDAQRTTPTRTWPASRLFRASRVAHVRSMYSYADARDVTPSSCLGAHMAPPAGTSCFGGLSCRWTDVGRRDAPSALPFHSLRAAHP